MDAFAAHQQDEGYSEDPLNPSAASSSLKRRYNGVSVLSPSRSGAEVPAWLMRQITDLPMQDRTNLAMAILGDLPTDLVAQVVEQLHPRLYIDFVKYLPPEVCLKVLGFLEPLDLIHVAQACRSWYELALDRKLWQRLYLLEGWKAKPAEIQSWEAKVNEDSTFGAHNEYPQRIQLPGYASLSPRRRVAPMSPELDADHDMVMVDADGSTKQELVDSEMTETSIFGGPTKSAPRSRGAYHLGELDMGGYGASHDRKDKGVDKGKAKADGAMELSSEATLCRIPTSTLGMWDATDGKYKINWKYLYTMRRRLESNWELGKFTNFQFPHPDFPEEGHGECIYSLQYDSQYLVSGSRDRTVRVWNLHTQRLARPPLLAHTGSVLCLQFDSDPDEDLIVSGSSDSSVVLWRFSTGKPIQRLRHAHREPVLNVKFDKRVLVTCSKDKTIKIFNRRPLHPRDLGYPQVDLVPRSVKDYAYELSLDRLPVIKPFTLIGCLEGHGAAVNAVQVHDREVVSASGDRHIKMWDWPSQVCTRTFVGHNKGIACVQYDGRRIVSGSSDNEVKVFDRHTGLEVATLRSHCSLVRTVQAGFGDLPYSVDYDAAEAKRVDAEYFKALEAGQLDDIEGPRHSRRQGNAGSSRPQDIAAYGARLPPGGGGGKYGRIVSGSYDTSIIVWRRDKEGVWKDQHRLKQEDAAAAALRRVRDPQPPVNTAAGVIPLHPTILAPMRQPLNPPTGSTAGPSTAAHTTAAQPPEPDTSRTQSALALPAERPTTPDNNPNLQITQVESPIYATLTASSIGSYQQMIDMVVPQGPQALAQALASYPTMLTLRSHLQAAIDREQSPLVKSQLRQVVNTSLFRTQFEQARQRRDAISRQQQQEAAAAATGATNGDGNGGEGSSTAQAQTQQAATASDNTTHASISTQATQASQTSQNTSTSPAAGQSQVQQAGPATTASSSGLGTVGTTIPTVTATAATATATAHQAHTQTSSSGQHQPLAPVAIAAAPQAQAPGGPHHPHIAAAAAAADANAPRVFKLQYDARRIICCSQSSVIVGWDFCNADEELEEASRFFAPVD